MHSFAKTYVVALEEDDTGQQIHVSRCSSLCYALVKLNWVHGALLA
jgi:hypothetical protein